MNGDSMATELEAAASALGVDQAQLAGLAGSLVWRIGRLSDDDPVTVRVGTTQALQQFAELPRLRSASDQEVSDAVAEGRLRVEWIGPRL